MGLKDSTEGGFQFYSDPQFSEAFNFPGLKPFIQGLIKETLRVKIMKSFLHMLYLIQKVLR